MLVKDLRYKAIKQDIDPRALRVALKYFLLVDTHLSKEHGLTEEDDHKLTQTAQELFKNTSKDVMERF